MAKDSDNESSDDKETGALDKPVEIENEILYRTMSKDHFALLEGGQGVQATGETFTSPLAAFSENYTGVMVKLILKPGTLAELEAIGVRDESKKTRGKYPDMPMVKDLEDNEKPWRLYFAYFKAENKGKQINIGLGCGRALAIVNANLISYEELKTIT